MKKVYNIFMLLFSFVLIVLCVKKTSIDEFKRVMENPFRNGVKIEQQKGSKEVLEKLLDMSEKYNLTIVKPINEHSSVDYYIYSPNNEFQRNILNVSDDNFKTITNMPSDSKEKAFSMFYNNKINFKSLEELKNISLEGIYNIYGEGSNMFLNDLEKVNAQYQEFFNISIEDSYKYQGNGFNDNYESGMYLILSMGMLIIACVLAMYLVDSNERGFAIRKLNGHDENTILKRTFFKDIGFPLALSVGISIILSILFVYLKGYLSRTENLYIFFKGLKYYIVFLFVHLVYVVLYLKFKLSRLRAKQMAMVIKSGRRNGNILNQLTVTGSIFIVVISLVWLYPDASELASKKSMMNNYKKYMDYTKVGVWNSKEVKNETIYKLGELWKILNDNGAVLFSKIGEDDAKVPINYIYINKKYIEISNLKDQNKSLQNLSDDSKVMDIIVPKKLREYKSDILQKAHMYHVRDKFLYEDILNKTDYYSENINNPDYRENIYYIEDSKNLFNFSNAARSNGNDVFLVINNKNVNGNAYIPTLPKLNIPNDKVLEQKIEQFFQSDSMRRTTDYTITPLKVELGDGLRFYEINVKIAVSVFIFSLLFLIMSIYTYASVYFQNNKNKISIKKFLGFDFFKIHKKIMMNFVISEILIFALSIAMAKYFENSIKYFYALKPAISINIVVLSMSFIVFIFVLRRNEKYKIVEVLKGE